MQLVFHNCFTQELTSEKSSRLLGIITNELEEGIPGITVQLKGNNQGTITDYEGKYGVKGIKPGSYIIKVSGVGYEKQEFQLTFNAGQKIVRSITLKESTSELDEVVVTAESEAQALTPSAKSVQVIETREVKLKSADYRNEIQNSHAPGLIDEPSLGINKAVAGSPFGEVVFTSLSSGINLHYKVNMINNWDFNLKAGYNYNERMSTDTARNLYNWLGKVVRVQIQPGEFGEADHLITKSESVFARQQLTYTLSEKHAFKLSVAPTYQYRTGDDLLIGGEFDPALDDGYLFDLVSGVEYTADLMDKRLQNIAFFKNYCQNIRIESLDPSIEGTLVDERSVSNYGAGNGIKYDWSARFSTKLSYEYAYRLPRQDEIFGDGQLILKNLELRPESSHNANLQWNYESKTGTRNDWKLQGNFFLRRVDDLIFLLVNQDDLGSFQNVWSATSQGFELSGRWKDIIKGLILSANTTYQEYLNTSQTGPFENFEGDRIPNIPYFFANGAAEYEMTDLIKKQDKLSIFWSVRYVNSFFVGWESAGLQQFKAEVPDQTIHAAGLTHRMNIKEIQNALTLEVQNLTNAKVFDLFGVQRPGRAFYIKSTIQF